MRTHNLDNITINYPDDVVFSGNPNVIEIEGAYNESVALLGIRNPYDISKEIEVGLYFGHGRIDISYIMQVAMQRSDSSEFVRASDIYVTLNIGYQSFQFNMYCIAGSLDIGQRFGQIGVYRYDPEEKAFIRRVRWFANYPQKLSIIYPSNSTCVTRYDGNPYGDSSDIAGHSLVDYDLKEMFPNAKQLGVVKYWKRDSESEESSFDRTFDYTFMRMTESVCMVRLYIDESKDGHFVKWLDRQGCWQYWLLSLGVEKISAKTGKRFPDIARIGSLDYRYNRVADKTISKEIRCAAVGVNRDEWEYLKTIISSTDVQMLIRDDVWQPIEIRDTSVNVDEKGDLFDIEVDIILPTQTTQGR